MKHPFHPIPFKPPPNAMHCNSQDPVWRSTLAPDFGDLEALGECLVLEFQAQEA